MKEGRLISNRTTTAIEFSKELSFTDCVNELVSLCRSLNSSPWWIGGAINFLEQTHLSSDEDRKKYGVKYKGALAATKLDVQTLRNYSYVDRKVEASLRRDELTWSHHLLIAALPAKEQSKYLQEAIKNQWTVAQMRKVLRTQNKAIIDEPKLDIGFVTTKWINEFRRGVQGEVARLGPVKTWEPALLQAWDRDLQVVTTFHDEIKGLLGKPGRK
jgi:hypothetical protein